MNYKLATVALMLLFNSKAGLSETLDEKLQAAYDAGYKDGLAAAVLPGGGGTGSMEIVRQPDGNIVLGGMPGTKGYELPPNFLMQGIGSDDWWDFSKIMDQLKQGNDVQIQGYVFDEDKLMYGKSKIFLDPAAPGKAFISGPDGIDSGKWIVNPAAADVLSVGEVLNLQSQGTTQGIIFEGVTEQQ